MTDQIPPRPTSFGPAPQPAETPTQEVVRAKPKRSATRTDGLGRVLTVKFLTPLDRMRLAKILGRDAINEVYLGYAALAFSVAAIDDEPTPVNNVREVEFLVERLAEEGLECVAEVYSTDFAQFLKGTDLEQAKN